MQGRTDKYNYCMLFQCIRLNDVYAYHVWPSGLAKSNIIMSMFVLFSWLFGYFESLAFFENGGTNLAPSSQTGFFSQFCKGTTQEAQSLSIEINSIINVYLIYVLYFTSEFRNGMVKIFTNT